MACGNDASTITAGEFKISVGILYIIHCLAMAISAARWRKPVS